MIYLLRLVSQATLYIICFPRIVVVTYVNMDIHSTCLIITLSCLKGLLLCVLYTNLSHLTTNMFLFYVLFCVFPVCYDVCLSHLNKDRLLTYLLTTVWLCLSGPFCQRLLQISQVLQSLPMKKLYRLPLSILMAIFQVDLGYLLPECLQSEFY